MYLHKEFSESVGAQPIGMYRHSPCPSEGERVCSYEGCTTVLSIYNPDHRCTRHSFLHTQFRAASRRRGPVDGSQPDTAA